ncbi:MAG: TetR/AcrR family transcriptional regulator, partial [Akkermansia sp.]
MPAVRKSQADRSAETSGKILRAAQKLFAHSGFDGVTMRAIASEAGVNLASIVYYFENKEGLYLSVFRHYAEPLMEERMKLLKEADREPSLRAYA